MKNKKNMKRNTKILLIGGIVLAITGVGAYFLLRKPKRDDDILMLIDNNTSNNNTSTPTTSTTKTYPPTPFVNNMEGNHFRGFVNTEYPEIARRIDLDRSVSFPNGFNNNYIREAWFYLCKSYIDITNNTRFKNSCSQYE